MNKASTLVVLAVLGVIAAAVSANLPDLKRYMKIRSM
jgi:type II secretory pathway pseudopilin PulG